MGCAVIAFVGLKQAFDQVGYRPDIDSRTDRAENRPNLGSHHGASKSHKGQSGHALAL
jgi:hypothetical protein